MSDERKPQLVLAKRDIKDLLDEVLSFGPETTTASTDVSDRLRDLVKKLQEINRRIESLNSRL